MGILETLIGALIPFIIQEAQSLLGSKPDPKNHDWVMGMVDELVGVLDKHLPAWVKPGEDEIKALVVQAIEKALEMVENK